jgi:hypothetical protein
MEEGRIFDKLLVLDEKIDGIFDQLQKLNGTTRDHANWIYGQGKVCDHHRSQTDILIKEAAELHDYQVQLNSAFKASKVLFFVLWTLTLALATMAGALMARRA